MTTKIQKSPEHDIQKTNNQVDCTCPFDEDTAVEIGHFLKCPHLIFEKQTEEKWETAWKGSKNKLSGKMPANIMQPGKFMNIERGHFDINGKRMFFRSKWEANYALYLDFLIKQKQIDKWEYEVDVFVFEKIKFGTRSYRPDFKIFFNGTFHYDEVKGHMDAKSKTKINRMRIYYPKVVLNIIDSKSYGEIKRKVGKMLKFY